MNTGCYILSRGITRLEWGCVVVVLLGLAWGAPRSFAQSILHLKSGATHECTVLEYNQGVFTIELPNGKKKQAKQEVIDRIIFEAMVPEVLDAEFGLQDVPRPKPPVSKPKRAPRPKKTAELKLASNWEIRFERDDIAIRDTARLLSKCGTPQVNLKGTNIVIWEQVTYLMPLREAKKALGLTRETKKPLECAIFPPRSFFSHAFKGNFDDGFDQLFLITDFQDQVVGVQLQSNNSRTERWFPHYTSNYSTEWSLYNFVQGLKKSNPKWEVGVLVSRNDQSIIGHPPLDRTVMVNPGIIRIDSDLFTITRDRFGLIRSQKSRARTSLLLAQPIVDLMLYIVQNSQ